MSDVIFYGDETKKALNNFGRGQLPKELIKAYAEVKIAVITAQQESASLYSERQYTVLLEVCSELKAFGYLDQFPLSLKQGGAGTSIHMNINEVICGLANSRLDKKEYIHPLNDLAKFQSTNDTFPTAFTIIVYRLLMETEEQVILLQEILTEKEKLWDHILITGRTELRDALPMTVGQIFGSWAGAVQRDRWRLNKLKERVRYITLGGTAIGTCASAPRDYIHSAEKHLRNITGLPLCRSQNLTDEISNHDSYAETASGCSLLAGNLQKISNDLLLYCSSFINEFIHPDVQFGSSIMAVKTNPVFAEFIKGLSIGIQGKAELIKSYSFEGQLQLNVFLPFMLEEFLVIFSDLKTALGTLTQKLIPELKINKEQINYNLINSPALLNSLRDVLDYSVIKELQIDLKDAESIEKAAVIISEKTKVSKEIILSYINPHHQLSSNSNYETISERNYVSD